MPGNNFQRIIHRFGMITSRLLTQILTPAPHSFHCVLAHVLTFNHEVIGEKILLDYFELHDKDFLREGVWQAWLNLLIHYGPLGPMGCNGFNHETMDDIEGIDKTQRINICTL